MQIIMFLLMAAVAFPTVYLRKSEFTDNYWQAYIPADDSGEYWLQVGLGRPMGNKANGDCVTILDMTYGKLCDAEQIPGVNSAGTENTAEITGAAVWDPATNYLAGGWTYLGENGGSTEITVDLEDDHNEVHVLYHYIAGKTAAQINFDWVGGSTTDLLHTNLTDYDTVGTRELILLKGTAVGTRVLRITSGATGAGGDGYTTLVGLRSWNTNETGNLVTNSDSCLVTQFRQELATGTLCTVDPTTCLNTANTISIGTNTSIGRAYEFGVSWEAGTQTITGYASYDSGTKTQVIVASHGLVAGDTVNISGSSTAGYNGSHVISNVGGSTFVIDVAFIDNPADGTLTNYDISGGNPHLVPGSVDNNVLTPATPTYDDGPEIWVDDVKETYNFYSTSNTRGTILSGDKIVIRLDGTIVGAQDASVQNFDWYFVLDDTGITTMTTIEWDSDILFPSPYTCYTPELPMSSTLDSGGVFRFPQADTEVSIPATDTTYSNKGSVAEVIYSNPNFVTRLIGFSPISDWLYVDSSSKFYGWVQGSNAGGTTPASGDVLVLGGKYEVRKLNSNGSEDWQSVSGGSSGALYPRGLY